MSTRKAGGESRPLSFLYFMKVKPKGNFPLDADERMHLYMRHLVALHWTDIPVTDAALKKYGGPRVHTVSGFVMSVQGYWFWVTAGHIIHDLNSLQAEGRRVEGLKFVDGLGKPNTTNTTIPFPHELPLKSYVNDDDSGVDFAVLLLSDLIKSLMQANGVVAIAEDRWKKVAIERVDNCEMLGIPVETTNETEAKTLLRPCLAPIAHDSERMRNFKTSLPRFIGRLIDKDASGNVDPRSLKDMDGMSGAPIFCVYLGHNGYFDYCLCAIQSGWLPEQRQVMGTFAAILGEVIERCLAKADANSKE